MYVASSSVEHGDRYPFMCYSEAVLDLFDEVVEQVVDYQVDENDLLRMVVLKGWERKLYILPKIANGVIHLVEHSSH